MIELILTDDTTTSTLPKLEIPLTETTVESVTDTTTLDNNVYSDFISGSPNKREWSHTWAYLSKDEFDTIKGFYDRQFSSYKYPLLTCEYYSILDVPVRMSLTVKKTIDNCGTINDVEVIFRESTQLEDLVSA